MHRALTLSPLRAAALGFCAALCLAAGAARAEIGKPISFIRVEGTQRVEQETVRAYMVIREGIADRADLVDQSVKTLFSSGLFADVTIRREGLGLVVTVIENPIINRVSFEGNLAINDDTLGSEAGLSARQIYTRAKVQDDVERFIELYRRSGRFAVRIEPKVIQLPQNRIDLVFEINEGPTTGIRAINITGNRAFSDDELRGEIITRETRWWRIFSSNDNYDPDRIAYDRELLRRFYLSRGYADFRVVASNAELTRDGEAFFVNFTLDEGGLYEFGEGRISTTLDSVDIVEMEEQIAFEAGERYDSRRVDDTVDALTKMVGEQGYAFADVRPRVRRDRERNIVAVEFVIEEGPRVYVERININGNTRTQDDVIRRELRLSEGDAFNQVLLSRSERNVRALGFFSGVQVSETPGSDEDKTVIDVNVREQPTGELSFGVGYSSAEALTTQFSVAERNFLGRGQRLRFSLGVSNQVQRYNIGFTEPYFLGRDISAGFSLFNTDTEYDYQDGLRTNEQGIGFSLGFPLSEDGRLSLFLNFSQDELINTTTTSNFNPSYKNLKQELGYYYSIDKRDDVINPTDGWNISFGQDLSGPSGDVSYLRTTGAANFFEEFGEGWIFHQRGTLGIIHDYRGDPINYNDRFFRGGRNFRGFERGGIGPRLVTLVNGRKVYGQVQGSNRYLIGTSQVALPLGIPKEVGMRANAFLDYGFIGEVDSSAISATQFIEDEMIFRATYGLSFAWRSPFGPVRFDFARPIAKEDYDETRFFRFTIGTSF